MSNLTVEMKEECLFAFLLKIFIESEDKSTDNVENANNAEKSENDEKKQEIVKRKCVINYVKVCNI